MSADLQRRTICESLLFFILTAAVSFGILPFNYFINPDGAEYIRLGQNLFSGAGLSVNAAQSYVSHPPLYSFFIGLLALLTGKGEFAGHFLSTAFFALAGVPFFLAAASAYGLPAARWFGLLYLSHGFLLSYANYVIAEPLLILWIGFMLWIVQNAAVQSVSRRQILLAAVSLGACGGLAYLTHPLGALFYAVAVLSFFLTAPGRMLEKLAATCGSMLVFLLFAVPYLYFVQSVTDQIQLSGVALRGLLRRYLDMSKSLPYSELKKIYEGLSYDKTEFRLDEIARHFTLWDYLIKDKFAALRYALPTLSVRIAGLSSYLYAGLGFVLIGAGLFNMTWNARRKRIEAVRFLFLLPFTGFAFMVFEQRYYLPFIPLLLLWAALGLERVREWLAASLNWNPVRSAAATGLLCLLMILPSSAYVGRSIRLSRNPIEHQELGRWMRENISGIQKETVAAQVPYAAFYSGAGILRLPYVELFDDLRTYLRHHRARYFVVGDDLDTPTLHSYRFLFTRPDDPAIPSGIKQVHAVRGLKNIYLYEVQGELSDG